MTIQFDASDELKRTTVHKTIDAVDTIIIHEEESRCVTYGNGI